jgi:hypothetical protein
MDAACLRAAGGRSFCPLQVKEPLCISLENAGNVILARLLFVAIVHAASWKNKHLLLIAVDGFYANVSPKIKVSQNTSERLYEMQTPKEYNDN